MAERVTEMLRGLTAALWSRLSRLHGAIAAELRRRQQEQMDEAYIATRGDRPFMGCGPCVPGSPAGPAEPRVNPAAVSREE
jgi:hypothetical protein